MSTYMEIYVPYKGRDCHIKGRFSPATPDVMYLRNGDPGYPGDPAEFDFDSITCDDEDPPPDPFEDDDFYDAVLMKAEETLGDMYDEARGEQAADRAYWREYDTGR